MPDSFRVDLSKVRIQNAEECLKDAKELYESGGYKGAANRSYYAAFQATRAILALDGIDMKHHSGIISEFRRLYIKTGILDSKLSDIIGSLSSVRNNSDYDDFYIISKNEISLQIENAEFFITGVKEYLTKRYKEQ